MYLLVVRFVGMCAALKEVHPSQGLFSLCPLVLQAVMYVFSENTNSDVSRSKHRQAMILNAVGHGIVQSAAVDNDDQWLG
ncbi:hypothetical protein JCM39068_15870 [Desulfocastanea catecholica]